MDNYVVGFLLDGNGKVALIQKNRPEWQRGKLNGVGGHIENGETPLEAMIREFEEEAGCRLNWMEFCLIEGDGYALHCFKSRAKVRVETRTDEQVSWYGVNKLPANIIPNLAWLIPMADYKYDIMARVRHESPTC